MYLPITAAPCHCLSLVESKNGRRAAPLNRILAELSCPYLFLPPFPVLPPVLVSGGVLSAGGGVCAEDGVCPGGGVFTAGGGVCAGGGVFTIGGGVLAVVSVLAPFVAVALASVLTSMFIFN